MMAHSLCASPFLYMSFIVAAVTNIHTILMIKTEQHMEEHQLADVADGAGDTEDKR